MPTLNKLEYLDETKGQIKTALNQFGAGITDNDTFRSYVSKINNIYTNWSKVTGEGTDLTLTPTKKAKITVDLKGNSSQAGEPTPTTPIPVKSVTGENSLVIQNENLFDVNDITRGYELQPDGRTNVKPGWYVSDYIKVTPNTHYYLSGTKTSGQANNFYDIDKNIISSVNKLTGLLTTPSDCYYVRFNGLLTQLSDISFVKGSTSPSTYVEHEEQNYQLSLGNIELNSSPDGTIRDAIIGTPDNWVKREYIGKVVLDGSETIQYTSANNHFDFSVSNCKPGSSGKPNVISNNYTGKYSFDNYSIFSTSYGNQIAIIDNRFTNVDDFKTWLSTHNTIVWYQKAQYTDIPITDTTLINQLNDVYNNAHSYNGVTNITTTYEDGNEQMVIEASALMKGGN